jgi:hypothetical protein
MELRLNETLVSPFREHERVCDTSIEDITFMDFSDGEPGNTSI